jgi:fermentation-respiration switch protein FrsA (DUF1100 family)
MSSNPAIHRLAQTPCLRTWLHVVVVATIISIVAIFAYCWRLALAAVAPAPSHIGAPPSDLPIESVNLASESGAKIAGWYLPAENARGAILLAHPIRGSRLSMLDRARLFRDAGYATLMIDLRAHGESTGDSITMGHLERHDIRAAVAFLKVRHPNQPIAVDGWSLGGAAALMASPLGIDALILEEVYPAIDDAIENRTRMRVGPLGPLAASILLWQLRPHIGIDAADLRPIDKLAAAGCPVLILAGTDDLHTTAAQTDQMFAAARDPKECVFFDGAAHVDLMKFDLQRFSAATLKFLDKHMRPKTPADR